MEQVAADLIKKYYSVLDSSKRNGLDTYYDANAVMFWNNNFFPGRFPDSSRFSLPSMKHKVDSIKANLEDNLVKVEAKGILDLDGQGTPFKETFNLRPVVSDLGFLILEQRFNFGN
ncbi:hypothetical protein DL93DRAFT_2234331 [Clavulina sp. PMI_390]|nr:hypothetical protein DL93DRAFT_2234331 [Clavulina sp. PMI_390]